MDVSRIYKADDKMSRLIGDNYSFLMVLSRFGIPLGFGDKSVQEVCAQHQVDCPTFLAVVNFIQEGHSHITGSVEELSVSALMDYLQKAHRYFLDFCLPTIRRKLLEAIDYSQEDEIAYLILKFYDEYVREVRKHMDYEDKHVFTYVSGLLKRQKEHKYHIGVFSKKHSQIDLKLSELKNIIIKYYSAGNTNLLNAVLFDIFSCEEDLSSHCLVEDYLFTPAVLYLEKQVSGEERDGGEEVRNA